jgi:hypothetical protein
MGFFKRMFFGDLLDFFPVLLTLALAAMVSVSVLAVRESKISKQVERDFSSAAVGASPSVKEALAQAQACALNKTGADRSDVSAWRRTQWVPCQQQGEYLLKTAPAELLDFQHRIAPVQAHWARMLFSATAVGGDKTL